VHNDLTWDILVYITSHNTWCSVTKYHHPTSNKMQVLFL